MSRGDTDPTMKLAAPLFRAFARSAHCPVEHRWHARSTLPVLAMFLTMCTGYSGELRWLALDVDALVAASLETEPEERRFLQDLLDVSASFYAFLGATGQVSPLDAHRIRRRLAAHALGLRSAA